MNREDANETLQENIDKGDILSGYIEFSIDLNRIIDDFESRTCENCEYGMDKELSVLWCSNTNQFTPKFCTIDFGCNQFERKTDE